MTHRVLFVVTGHRALGDTGKETGYFLSEVSHPHKVLTEAGFGVDFVTPGGGEPPMDPKSLDRDDPDNSEFLDRDEWKGSLDRAESPSAVDPARYSAIFYAGGHGAMWDFPDDERLAALAQAIYDSGGVVGAVCHGPAGLVNVRRSDGRCLVDGLRVACFTNSEEKAVGLDRVVPFLLQSRLEERGARHSMGGDFEAHVAVDGRLVTGQNPASARGVGEAMVRLLQEADTRGVEAG